MARLRRPARIRRDNSSRTVHRDDPAVAENPKRPGRSRQRILFIAAVLLATFLYVLPTLIVVTPLKQLAIDQAFSKFRGRVQIQGASLGWFSPVRLTGVSANDEMGQSLFHVQSLTTEKSLLALIFARELGRIDIQEPAIHVRLRHNGSNIEDAIAQYLEPSSSSSTSIRCQINITGGTLALSSDQDQTVWNVQQLDAVVKLMQGSLPLAGTISGSVVGRDVGPGQFRAEVVVDEGLDRLVGDDVKIDFNARQLPTAAFQGVLCRLLGPRQLGGLLDGAISAHWSGKQQNFLASAGPATIQQFRYGDPRRLGTDVIQFEQVKLEGQLALTPNSVAANQFACQTDVGNITADGSMSWDQIAELASGGQLPNAEFQSSGELDIARLAAMLPRTLPLQQGLEIQNGTLQFMASSRIEQTARRMLVNVESRGLTAVGNGQTINWDKPIRVVSVLRQTPDTLIVESFDCQTTFLQITGSASADHGKFSAQGDLAKAVQELNRVFDLGGFRMAGQVNGDLEWKFDGAPAESLANRPVRIGGRFHIDKPMIKWPDQPRWRQRQIDLTIQAAGRRVTDGNQGPQIHINNGHLELQSGQERLVADLAQPVINPGFGGPMKLQCQVIGDIGNWLAQLNHFVPIDFVCSGQVNATALVIANRRTLGVQKSELEFVDFVFDGYGLTIREPKVVADLQMNYNLATGAIRLPAMTVASSALSARGQKLVLDPADGQHALRGDIAFRADMNRFLAWFSGPSATDSVNWFGDVQGTVQLSTDADSMAGTLDATVHDLVAAKITPPQPGIQTVASRSNWTRLFEEKQLSLQSRVKLNRALDQLTINRLALESSAVTISGKGSVSDLFSGPVVDFQGTWNPDWQRLERLAKDYLGDLVTFQEIQGHRFQISGPLFNPDATEPGSLGIHPGLRAATTISWKQGSLLGLPFGPSRIRANLDRGIATAEPLKIPFSGGTVNVKPRVDLNGTTPILEIEQGKIVDQVQITPVICRGWLKFVAPVIADATSAEGRFSITTTGIRLPLEQPQAADFAGNVLLHGASVGPGPLGQQLIGLVAQVKSLANGVPPMSGGFSPPTQTTWMTMPEQSVPFAVKNGRVFHDGMKFQIDDVTIETAGSVGLDQTVHLLARVPIQDRWLGDQPWTAALKGQTLEIPIGGLVSQPQIDSSRLQNMAQQLITGATNKAIQNELNNLIQQGNQKLESELLNGINKLLGPKK